MLDASFPGNPLNEGKGVLTIINNKRVQISLPDVETIGQCGNFEFFEGDAEGAAILTKAYEWKSVRVVKSRRAYFYESPAAESHGKRFLVAGDGVGITGEADEWLHVDYTSGAKPVSRWMKSANFY